MNRQEIGQEYRCILGNYKIALMGDSDIGIDNLMVAIQEIYYPTISFSDKIDLIYPPNSSYTTAVHVTIVNVSELTKVHRNEVYKTCDDIYFIYSAIKPQSLKNIDDYLMEARDVLGNNKSTKFGFICLCSEIYKNTKTISDRNGVLFDEIKTHMSCSTYNISCIQLHDISSFTQRCLQLLLGKNNLFICSSKVSIAYQENILFFSPRIRNFLEGTITSIGPITPYYIMLFKSWINLSNDGRAQDFNGYSVSGIRAEQTIPIGSCRESEINFNHLTIKVHPMVTNKCIIKNENISVDEIRRENEIGQKEAKKEKKKEKDKEPTKVKCILVPFLVSEEGTEHKHDFKNAIQWYNKFLQSNGVSSKAALVQDSDEESVDDVDCFSKNKAIVSKSEEYVISHIPVIYLGFFRKNAKKVDSFTFNKLVSDISNVLRDKDNTSAVIFEEDLVQDLEYHSLIHDPSTFDDISRLTLYSGNDDLPKPKVNIADRESMAIFFDALTKGLQEGNELFKHYNV